jgi:CheY-like chemotaxis protein
MSDVLFVEDSASEIVVALRAFRLHGLEHRITILRDGAEVLHYLTGNGDATSDESPLAPLPKVVMLDLRMPRLDGLEVLQRVRANERTREVPIVVVTSSQARNDVLDCYRMGANSFVVKRVDLKRPGEYLVDIARYWLELNRVAG